MAGIKGSWQELYAGKEKAAITKTIGKTIHIFYSDIKNIEYQFSDNSRYGFLKFNKYDGNSERFVFKQSSNSDVARIIDVIKKKYTDIGFKEVSQSFNVNDRINLLPRKTKVLYFGTCFLVIFVSLFLMFESFSGFYNSEGSITLDEYNRCETGMTYEEVVKIIGEEGEPLAETEIVGINSSAYIWYGNGVTGANAEMYFTDNKLTSKAQIGLE